MENNDRMDITPSSISLSLRIWMVTKPIFLQQDVAQEVGVTRQTMTNWAAGTAIPNVMHIGKLENMKPGLVALIFGE